MKKIIILLFIFLFSKTHAQDKDWIFFKDYNLFLTQSILTGNSMTSESHKNYALGFELKIGIVEYKKIGLAAFYNYSKHNIDNIQMIGDFDNTTYTNLGFVFRYNYDINDKNKLKPEIGLSGVNASDNGDNRTADYSGLGYLFGTDYIYKLSRRTGIVVGLHYQHTTFNIDTTRDYKKYFRNSNQILFKVGFNFG